MKQAILVLPSGCMIAGPAGAAGAAGAPGAAGARGAAEGIGFITGAQVAGTFVGSGQVLFFGPDTTDGTYRWIHDPALLATRVMMGLILDAVDPTATEVVYGLKVLTITGVSGRTVSIPVQFIANAESGITLFHWVDAVLYTPEVGSAYYRMNCEMYSGHCGGVALRMLSSVGDDLVCVSEISA